MINVTSKKTKKTKKTKKPIVKKAKKVRTKKTKKKSSNIVKSDIIFVDEDIPIDKESELEARKAYLEEARSQESSGD